MALLYGQPISVECFTRHLYPTGVLRSQTLTSLFLPHAWRDASDSALQPLPWLCTASLERRWAD